MRPLSLPVTRGRGVRKTWLLLVQSGRLLPTLSIAQGRGETSEGMWTRAGAGKVLCTGHARASWFLSRFVFSSDDRLLVCTNTKLVWIHEHAAHLQVASTQRAHGCTHTHGHGHTLSVRGVSRVLGAVSSARITRTQQW